MTHIVLVGLGGFVGTVLRYLLSLFLSSNFKFPLSTLTVNLIGSFLIGIILPLPQNRINSNHYLFITTGLLGGFTTFSAFSGEVISFLAKQQYLIAFSYLSISIIGGILICCLGYLLINRIF